MKVQMRRQSLRLRIDERQLAALQAGEAVENITHLAPGVACRQVVTAVDDDGPARLEVSPEAWTLRLPRTALDAYAARLPCRDGLEFALPAGEGETLQVSFEVDVRDSVRNRGSRKRKPRDGGDDGSV